MNVYRVMATCHIHGCDKPSFEIFKSAGVLFAYCVNHSQTDGHTRFSYVGPYSEGEEDWA